MKIIIISLLVLLTSCSSYKKSAIKLTEEGLHESALDMWVLAYKDDPKDPEIQAGLLMCQEKVSNERLVRIRDLRNAREEEQAIIEMQKLIQLQGLHGFRLDFNSSTFQGRETLLLSKYNNAQILRLTAGGKPLAAELRYRLYNNVFESQSDYKNLRTEINNSGNLQCKSLKKNLKGKPFFRSFISQYCKFFNPESKFSATKETIANVLYANPMIEAEITGVDAEGNAVMTKALKEGFEASPWFHPEATKTISLKVTGHYKWNKHSETIPQSHSYNVEIPYTAYVSVKKEKDVPYETTEYNCDYGGGRSDCKNRPVTKFRKETYYESEPVTKYRTETRVFKYDAIKRTLSLELALQGKIMIEKLAGSFTYNRDETETAILHDNNMPEINLSPKTTDVSSPNTVFQNYSVLTGVEERAELERTWIKNFCSLPQDRSFPSIGENVTRCRRAPNYPVPFVDTWFENTFGVNSRDAETIIGKF